VYIPYKKNIQVIPNGVGSLHEFLKHTPSPEQPTIIWVGRMSKEKNVSLLLKIFSEVTKKIPKAKLLCIGDGPLRKSLEQEAQSLHIFSHLIFTGSIAPHKLYAYYKRSSVFVLPSEREGFGIVAIEAMAMSLPVVASNVGSLPEIIDDHVTGYLCKPNSINSFTKAIIHLLTHADGAKKMGYEGRKKVIKMYDWKNIAQTVAEKVYAHLYG
jgi:glycosyltransferase involved in cell wall biosynthesis